MSTIDAPGAGPGELVAIDLPPGEAWLEIVSHLWWRGVAFLPLDPRWTAAERAAVIDRAQPSSVWSAAGETAFPGTPVPDGLGVIVATSGTGGELRLAELSRAAAEAAVAGSAAALGAPESSPWLSCLTPAHIGGLLVLLRGAVLGAPVIVHEGFSPSRLAASVEGGAMVSVVPTMVARSVQHGARLDGLTMLVGGGELPAGIREAARGLGAHVVTTYGLTESCGGVVYDGWPWPDLQVRLSDGAIEMRGPTVMQGYRRDEAATGAAFTVDGWLRTGDMGSLADDGRLEVHGRIDDLIRSGGEKVWPDEVESVLARHPKVADAAVAGVPHPEWGAQVGAWVVPRAIDDPPGLEELRDWASERIARYKAPGELHLVTEIPRTSSGKVRRSRLHR